MAPACWCGRPACSYRCCKNGWRTSMRGPCPKATHGLTTADAPSYRRPVAVWRECEQAQSGGSRGAGAFTALIEEFYMPVYFEDIAVSFTYTTPKRSVFEVGIVDFVAKDKTITVT